MEYKVGENIAYYRKIKGYTQEQLGELVGVSGQAVSKWEKGGFPDTYLLPTISQVLGVTIDALFGVEKKISDYSEDEILDTLFRFCQYQSSHPNTGYEPFRFLFETLWTLQNAAMGIETLEPLNTVIDKNQGNPQISSQLINNTGTTYLSLVKGFPFFYAVWDSPEISKKILNEDKFVEFFSLLASEDGLKAILFTQCATESSQYTAEAMAKKIGISQERFFEIEPLLVKYGLLNDDTLALNDRVIKVYHKWSNPEIRPLLMMAYQFINARQCYFNFTCNRSKPYFEIE